MTASFVIVNTSNWDGENLKVFLPNRDGPVELAPGEQAGSSVSHVDVTKVDIELHADAQKPFYLEGKEKGQVFPYVISGVGSQPKVSRG